jgi:fructose-1,6-bisphosphatase/inositol monophosphatase family enzyme
MRVGPAAAAIIIAEAGGIITDHHGKERTTIPPSRACRVWWRAGSYTLVIERTNRVDL